MYCLLKNYANKFIKIFNIRIFFTPYYEICLFNISIMIKIKNLENNVICFFFSYLDTSDASFTGLEAWIKRVKPAQRNHKILTNVDSRVYAK